LELRLSAGTATLGAVRIRSVTPALLLLVAACVVANVQGAIDPAAHYVLTARDVGVAYRFNPSVSGRRSLSDLTVGDSARVQAEIRRTWLGGTVAGFNSVSGKSGVISIADVFRSGSRIDAILRAWQADAAHVLHGTRERVPDRSPGTHPALVRGKLLSYQVLVYMWSHGNAIASVEVTGLSADVGRAFLLRLARAQDAKLKAS
jgi:hypothetical protein